MRRKNIKLVTLMISVIALTGCFFRRIDPIYTGEYPELFSVALGSLLGARGYSLSVGSLPDLIILEEDDYGRILFEYSDGGGLYPSRLIMQKTEGDYAYFYQHYNFIIGSHPIGISFRYDIPDFVDEEMVDEWLKLQEEYVNLCKYDPDFLEDVIRVQSSMLDLLREIPEHLREVSGFTDEAMSTLKETNSWNQVMSGVSEFARVRIVRQKEAGPISLENLAEVHNTIFSSRPTANRTRSRDVSYRMVFLRTDNYGRSVYLGGWQDDHIVVLFQPNQLFNQRTGPLEIAELNNYQTELRLFMEANGWDTSFRTR